MFRLTDKGDYLHMVFQGNNLAQLLETIDHELREPAFAHRNDIWEIGQAPLEIQFGQLEDITEHILARYPRGATRTRTAIVVAPGLNAGFAEIWAGSAGRLPYEVRVFHDFKQAEAWVTDVPLA